MTALALVGLVASDTWAGGPEGYWTQHWLTASIVSNLLDVLTFIRIQDKRDGGTSFPVTTGRCVDRSPGTWWPCGRQSVGRPA
jgi:hypothetical protein